MFQGMGLKQTAEALQRSVETVRLIRSRVYKKAGVSGALDLVAMAYRNGGFLW
jgi:DNA-binding CsgD family transcriptional regulator